MVRYNEPFQQPTLRKSARNRENFTDGLDAEKACALRVGNWCAVRSASEIKQRGRDCGSKISRNPSGMATQHI